MKHLTKSLVMLLAAVVLLAGCTKKSSEKQILSFSFYAPEVEATVMESEKIIVATVPGGTDVTALVPTITVSDKATVNPASGVRQDFTNPVTYTVTAENGTQADYTVTVTVENGGGGEEQHYTIIVSANPAEGGTATATGSSFVEGEYCTVTATANSGYTFINWTENGSEVSIDESYTFTVTGGRNLVSNFTSNGGGNANEHDYVDLGLPSGTLWATCNVGANSPEDYGDYFAWGETYPKDDYDWGTYQYCCDSSFNTLTKYCYMASYGCNGFTDDLTTLLPEDDAATVQWGPGWRMPTTEQWQELVHNTTITSTTQNGENGRLFTANGNSLFLPAAGYRWHDELDYAGSLGNYCSSSLGTVTPSNAMEFHFDSGGCFCGNNGNRSGGRSVRAVRSVRQN